MEGNEVLSIEQMKHLKELGVDATKASLYIWKEGHGDIVISNGNAPEMKDATPVFTLQDMLEMMPQNIDVHTLLVSKNATAYQNVSWSTMKVFCNEGILINTYNMLCWLAENKLLGKEEKHG